MSGGPRVLSVRAGNVVGGGDFAINRIIPDLIRCVISGKSVEIRSPESTRPWQHALDPLRGYLLALEDLLLEPESTLINLNFGHSEKNMTVLDVAQIGKKIFPILNSLVEIIPNDGIAESIFLEINASASAHFLDWKPYWTQEQAITNSFIWWKKYLAKQSTAEELCENDIINYLK
jgi:CDP-glucose 4,6-dehydratase